MAVSGGLAAEPVLVSGIQATDIDRSVRPQDDLFLFANGTWLRTVPIPADRARYGVDVMMTEHSLRQQRDLIEAIGSSTDPNARKVADLYLSFMDEAAIERAGIEPLRAELQRVAVVKSVHDLGSLMAHFDRLGIRSPLSGYVAPDAKKSTEYAYWLGQGGLGLPDRDYFLSGEAKFVRFRQQYRDAAGESRAPESAKTRTGAAGRPPAPRVHRQSRDRQQTDCVEDFGLTVIRFAKQLSA